MLLAAGTSPAIHFDLAPISHKTSSWGQQLTASFKRFSSDSRVPWFFSKYAARSQIDFFVGKTEKMIVTKFSVIRFKKLEKLALHTALL